MAGETLAATLAAFRRQWEARDADAAAATGATILAAWPLAAEPLRLVGLALFGLDRLELAVACLQAACESPRALPAYHYELAVAHLYTLTRSGRPADALAAADDALARWPNEAKLHELRGMCCLQLARTDDALAAYERARALEPAAASAWVGTAEALMDLGRGAEAQAALESALAIEPDLAAAWNGLASLRAFAPGDPLLATMETQLAVSPRLQRDAERLVMHFALGNAYLRAGEPDRAFAHLAAGNRLKRATIAYDVARDERRFAATAAAYGADVLGVRAAGGAATAAPIFVIGMPRSGTTLIEQILASHPAVHGAGELPFVERLVADVDPRRLDPAAATELGARYLSQVAAVAPAGARVVDKMPGNFQYAGAIYRMLPGARIVHVRRDALDVCCSCFATLFTGRQDFAYDLGELGRYYRAYEGLIEHWRTVLPPEIFLEIAYEDVVADLAGSVRRLLAFCDLPWDDACVRFHETRRAVRTASHLQVRRPLYATSVGRAAAFGEHLRPLVDALARK